MVVKNWTVILPGSTEGSEGLDRDITWYRGRQRAGRGYYLVPREAKGWKGILTGSTEGCEGLEGDVTW